MVPAGAASRRFHPGQRPFRHNPVGAQRPLVLAIFIPLFELGILGPHRLQHRHALVQLCHLRHAARHLHALMALFQRFQMTILERERRAHDELLRAQTLLEEQNATLEQNVQRRTQELQQSNQIITALYGLTEAANAARNLPEFYAQVHSIVSELMYAKNLFIALYDEKTGLLSFPYFVDEQDEPFSTLPLADFARHDQLRHPHWQFDQAWLGPVQRAGGQQ